MDTEIICTVDVVLLTLQEQALHVALVEREHGPFEGHAALPGGFIDQTSDPDARAAAVRVLRTKAGVNPPYLEQLATFSGARRDPRGWSLSVVYYALVAPQVIAARPGLSLVPVDAAPKLPFDHTAILAQAVARLRSKGQYSSLPCFLAGEHFTLPQLQRIYEVVMAEPLNKVSFRRKMEEMDVLEAVPGQFDSSGAHRPAQLHRLKSAFSAALTLLERGL